MADDNDENEVASDLPTNETGNSTENTAAKAEEGGGLASDVPVGAEKEMTADPAATSNQEQDITEPAKNTTSLSLEDFADDILNDVQSKMNNKTELADSAHPKTTEVLENDIDNLLFNSIGGKKTTGATNEIEDIEALLGNSNIGKVSGTTQNGMEAILKKTMIYYERLPMLEVVFDRLIRLLSTSFRNFTGDNVNIRTEASKSMRFGEYLNSIPLPAMIGVFKAEEWDNQGLIVVDSELTYSVVDVLLGGRHSSSSSENDGRIYTTIESNLICKLMTVFLEELGVAFEPVCDVHFIFERLELNPHFAMISRSSNAGVLLKLGVEIDDRYGKITLFLPYATIEPIRELLLQNFMGEKFGRDSIWEDHLVSELKEADIIFDIHIANEVIPLYEVLRWRVGRTIHFSSPPPDIVIAKSGDQSLFSGAAGYKNGKIAIKVLDNLLLKEEFSMENNKESNEKMNVKLKEGEFA